MTATDDYLAAVRAFADQVARLASDGWDVPALGDWTLRRLVAHTASMTTSVLDALAAPADASVGLDHASGYYALRRRVDPAVLEAALSAAAAGLEADVEALGPEPASTVARWSAEVEEALRGADEAAVVATPAGGMFLRDFLAVRTFELAVHALDIAAATGVGGDLPAPVLAAAATLAATTAVEVGDGATVLRALTGRAALPEGYSAL